MKTKDVKLNIEYRYKNEIVKVVKRIRNTEIKRWYVGFGPKAKCNKYKECKQMSFMLNDGNEVYANELSRLN